MTGHFSTVGLSVHTLRAARRVRDWNWITPEEIHHEWEQTYHPEPMIEHEHEDEWFEEEGYAA